MNNRSIWVYPLLIWAPNADMAVPCQVGMSHVTPKHPQVDQVDEYRCAMAVLWLVVTVVIHYKNQWFSTYLTIENPMVFPKTIEHHS